jgi:hypothetical protein
MPARSRTSGERHGGRWADRGPGVALSYFPGREIQSSTTPLLNNAGIQNVIKSIECRVRNKVTDEILHEASG